MKAICRKLAALCGSILMSACSVLPAFAEQAEDDTDKNKAIMLPSGISLAEMIRELESADTEGDAPTARDRGFASAAVGVFQGDTVLYTDYFGLTDFTNYTPADEDAVYEWGSISKTMIWVSVMQLWEQGKLDLEADVRDYLPDGFFQHLRYDKPITMLNLMNHNAGWQEITVKSWFYDESEILPLKDALQAIEPAQVNPPGEVAAYSNYGAAVAAYVVECISGTDYTAYLHKHILEPLHMEHTAVNAVHNDNAWVYEQRKAMHSYRISPILSTCVDLGTEIAMFGAYPAGMTVGTLSDLITYAQALTDDSAPLFAHPETQKTMFTGTDFYGNSDIPINCHGFFCMEGAVRYIGHNGATLFGQANMFFDPESKTGVVTMCNEYNGNTLLSMPLSLVFGTLPAEKYRTDAAGEAYELSGHYKMARGVHSGMLSAANILQAGKLSGTAENIANHAYQLTDDEGMKASVIGLREYSDGSTGIAQTSTDIIPIRFYAFRLILFTLYVLTAVAAFYMLRIRKLFRKNGKAEKLAGEKTLIAGEWARLLSALAVLALLSGYIITLGNMENWICTALGILQIICAMVCVCSGGVSVFRMMKTKKIQKIRHILNLTGSVLTVGTVVCYQLYQFWTV